MRNIVIVGWILLVWGLISTGAWIFGTIKITDPLVVFINPAEVFLILVAIGILRKKDWARRGLIIWVSLILLVSFYSLLTSETLIKAVKVIIPITLWILILYFFTRKSVKEQFIEKQKSNIEVSFSYTKSVITVVNFFLIFFFVSALNYCQTFPPEERTAGSLYRLFSLILIVYPFVLNLVLSRFIKDRVARYRSLFRQFLGFYLLFYFAHAGAKSAVESYNETSGLMRIRYCFALMIIFWISRMFVWIQGKKANVQIKSKIIGDNK